MAFGMLPTAQNGAVVKATITAGDINLLDWRLMSDLNDLLDQVARNEKVKVLVLESANKDFFVAHFDLLPRLGMLRYWFWLFHALIQCGFQSRLFQRDTRIIPSLVICLVCCKN